jgi:glycosyltransferase involved in cell wall biosynthesis
LSAKPRETSANGRAKGPKKTVLFICHNHPSVRPGGAEAYALELHRHLRESEDFESVFLAKGGPPLSVAGRPHLGTCVAPVKGTANEYFFYTDDWSASYDWTFGTIRHDKQVYTKHLRAFLGAVRPDVVHLQHTMFFGYDVLREIKNTLPAAPIVYTLHEFMPICHRQGQMLRVPDDEPCMEESPRRCHECYPDISPQTFFLRKRFIQSHLSLVDLFIAPSEFLAQRYVDWGIPPEKIRIEEYGRTPPQGEVVTEEREFRDRFGFFGQLTPYKGLQVLLEAMALLTEDRSDPDDSLLAALEIAAGIGRSGPGEERKAKPHTRIHGANFDLQPGTFQNRVEELLQETRKNVTFVGRYKPSALASLISEEDWVVVPSLWWENSPLVIQEAFHFGRPVICSDIGGMAEKVDDGVNGLHFRAGDPTSLAHTIKRAAEEPGLWERLRDGIEPMYAMDEHVATLTGLYHGLLTRREGVRAG